MRLAPIARTMVSYIPSKSVLPLRRLSDFPSVLSRRPHEVDYLAFRKFSVDGPKVVDVGANRGQSAASFSQVLGKPRIWTFEPNQHLAEYLQRRFRSRDIVVYATGLGSSESRMTLYLPRYGHTVWDTRGSLVEDDALRLLDRSLYWRFTPDRAGVEKLVVTIRQLDEFDLAPDILKVDVEGAEAAVIEGGMETIRTHRPVILIEGTAEEAERSVGPLGYRRHRYDAKGRFVKGEPGGINTFLLLPDHYRLFPGIEVEGS